MNDLRLLQQLDPNKKVISLEFKQIAALEPMLPLLAKFQDLESLSLHGNRLKNLPNDMAMLQKLAELDISNNLFIDVTELADSLKTLPCLTHLIMNFKSHQQENFIKNSLPNLQRINKKPIMTHKNQFNFTQKKKNETQRLNEHDLQSIGALYDEIRDIHKNSKYFVDKELADDFSTNVENIMSQLAHKIKGNQNQVQRTCNIVCGKYALIDLCFAKLITYFYRFDKKIANVLQKIHDEQANMFKSISDLVFTETLRSKIQVSRVKTQKEQLYKAEIKRLKTYQNETNKQLQYVESKNKQLLEKLVKFGKAGIMQNAMKIGTLSNRSPNKGTFKNTQFSNLSGGGSVGAHKDYTKQKQNAAIITVKSKPKTLSINQLKQIINQIYESKLKYNQFCEDNNQKMETLQTHMYTYLNQKYGLKSLAVEWAMSIVNGIKKYGFEDPEIATFGKMLRNQVDQGFLSTLMKIKQNFIQNYRKFKSTLLTKGQAEATEISINESQEILLFMNLKREQIDLILNKLRNQKLTNNLITLDKLEKGVLDYFVRKHDQKIFQLHKQFKLVDEDEDGVIDIEQLQAMMKNINPSIDMEVLLELIDPNNKGHIVFSYLCESLINHNEFKDLLKIGD